MVQTRIVVATSSTAVSVALAGALAFSTALGNPASGSSSRPVSPERTSTTAPTTPSPHVVSSPGTATAGATSDLEERRAMRAAHRIDRPRERPDTVAPQRVPEQVAHPKPTTTPAASSRPTPSKAQPPQRPSRLTPGAQPTGRTSPPPPPQGPTGWAALNAAIARIPGYVGDGVRWRVSSAYGHLGATDLATGNIYISPSVSPSLLDSVVRHEYSHIVTVRAYNGQWRTAKSAMNAAFGGTGRTGVERAADCMALALGASWTHYTSCSRGDWQRHAQRLLSGRPL